MKTITIQQFKARCSGLGAITGDAQGKSNAQMFEETKTEIQRLKELNSQMVKKDGKMYTDREKKIKELTHVAADLELVKHIPKYPATLVSHCQEWLMGEIYGVKKNIWTKEMEKGNYCEGDAIQLAGKYFNWFMPEKNRDYRFNDWLTGTCDVVIPDSVEDIKCSWDIYTFPNFSREIPVKGYEKQLNGYMELWHKQKAGLVYVLMDTDEELDRFETCAQPIEGYDSWELSERIRRYEVERDEEFLQFARERVEDCRVLIQTELIPELEEWKKIKISIA